MKTKKYVSKLFFTTSLILLLFVDCNNGKTEKKENNSTETSQLVIENEKEVKTETSQAVRENETLIDSLVKNLSGIESFYVNYKKDNTQDQKLYYLLQILKYNNDPNFNKLKGDKNIADSICLIEPKKGNLITKVSGMDWNALYYYTYWNITDGTNDKLLAVIERSCDFNCQDNIQFYRIIKYNSENSDYRFEKVKSNDIIKNFDKLPEILTGQEIIDAYYHISYNLPQMGKNILMCYTNDINLNPEDDNTLERKGNCVELIWNGDQGTFTPGEQTNK